VFAASRAPVDKDPITLWHGETDGPSDRLVKFRSRPVANSGFRSRKVPFEKIHDGRHIGLGVLAHVRPQTSHHLSARAAQGIRQEGPVPGGVRVIDRGRDIGRHKGCFRGARRHDQSRRIT